MAHSNGNVPDGSELQALLDQARRSNRLDPDEKALLLKQAGLGDRDSMDRLVEAQLELVIRLAARRADQGLPLGDLVQEGSIGLMEAIRGFGANGDPGGFEAFAAERISARLDAALGAEAAAVREAELLVTAATDYERVELLLARELRRAPKEKEMAEKLEWTVERLRYVAKVVEDARRRHDEDLLPFIDPDEAEIEEEGA